MQEKKTEFNSKNPGMELPDNLFVPVTDRLDDAMSCMRSALSDCQSTFNPAQRKFTLRGLLRLVNTIAKMIPDDGDYEYAKQLLYICIHVYLGMN